MKFIVERRQGPTQISSATQSVGIFSIMMALSGTGIVPAGYFVLSIKLEISDEEAQAIKKYNKTDYIFGKSERIVEMLKTYKEKAGWLAYDGAFVKELEAFKGYKLSDLMNGISLMFVNVTFALLLEDLIKEDCKKFKEDLWKAVSYEGIETIEF